MLGTGNDQAAAAAVGAMGELDCALSVSVCVDESIEKTIQSVSSALTHKRLLLVVNLPCLCSTLATVQAEMFCKEPNAASWLHLFIKLIHHIPHTPFTHTHTHTLGIILFSRANVVADAMKVKLVWVLP